MSMYIVLTYCFNTLAMFSPEYVMRSLRNRLREKQHRAPNIVGGLIKYDVEYDTPDARQFKSQCVINNTARSPIACTPFLKAIHWP